MEVVDKARDVLEVLHETLQRSEPIPELTESLIRETITLVQSTRSLVGKAQDTLSRCDAILDEGPRLVGDLSALIRAQTALAEARLEAGGDDG